MYITCITTILLTWKSHGNVTVLFCLSLSARLPLLKIHLCPVNGCPPLLLLWAPPEEEIPGSCSPADLTAGAHINNLLRLYELEVESCHVLQPQEETNVPISIF